MNLAQLDFLRTLVVSLAAAGFSFGEPTSANPGTTREWTSADGRKLSAEYLGVRGDDVFLKLQNGSISSLATSKFSEADQSFIRNNRVEYREKWQAWPPDADYAMHNVDVRELPGKDGHFIYTTSHFRFQSDADLGSGLVKDLARVFELTHHIHSLSPFGILATPDDGLFNARLYGTADDYRAAGGPPQTAGVYLLKEKAFLAPLDMMGVRPGSTGWRKDRDYNPSTVIHELTHLLTHDMLNNLPIWVNEGYAEYISHIPIEKGAFQTSPEEIREGILDRFIREQERQTTGGVPRAIGIGERISYQKSGVSPELIKVAKVLEMTDGEWITGHTKTPPGVVPVMPVSGDDPNRLPILYRTAHLILYYFIQIEGEAGVTKVRRFIDQNRSYMAGYERYLERIQQFESEIEEFLKQPGVTQLANGQIQYPSTLTPPAQPEAPFTDPDTLKLGGLKSLLGEESAEVVGARIEAALRDDLGVKLRFENRTFD